MMYARIGIFMFALSFLCPGLPGYAQQSCRTNGGYPACYSEQLLRRVFDFERNAMRKGALLRRLNNGRCILLEPDTPVIIEEVNWSTVRILLLETGETMWTVRGAVFAPY